MACSTRPGVKPFLDYITAVTGEHITVEEWHQLREDATRTGDMSRTPANYDDIDIAFTDLRSSIYDEMVQRDPGFDWRQAGADAYEQANRDLDSATVTTATVTTIKFMGRVGFKNALEDARQRILRVRDGKRAIRDLRQTALTYRARAASEGEPGSRQNTYWNDRANGLNVAADKIAEDPSNAYWAEAHEDIVNALHPEDEEVLIRATQGSPEARKMDMFTRRGNETVLKAVNELKADIESGRLRRDNVAARVRYDLAQIKVNHPEVLDKGPQEAFLRVANHYWPDAVRPFTRADWDD